MGEIAWQLRELAALTENWSSDPAPTVGGS